MAKTQLDQIREHLRSGRSLSPLEALGLYGVFRLAARINELRGQGWDIITDIRHDPNGKKYAVYMKAPVKNTELPSFITHGHMAGTA